MPYLMMSDGAKIYYEVYGQGKTVLFCHGLNSSHNKIGIFMSRFKNEYRCVCYDQRGHGASERTTKHMNIKRLGEDIHELIEHVSPTGKFFAVGHSMGAASIFSYINQFGCNRPEKIVVSDMSPYMRNGVWEGGIGQGKHTDEDFLQDMEKVFDDVGSFNFNIAKNLMRPDLKLIPKEMESFMITAFGADCDPFATASLWYSLFRTDQRPVMEKITVPLLYLMPEFPLYSMTAVNFIREHVKGKFVLAKDFPNTTHLLLMEQPDLIADCVKKFFET